MLLEQYLHNRKFQVHYGDAVFEVKYNTASIPQGSVLGPYLYLLYTIDISATQAVVATFADDTAPLAPHWVYNRRYKPTTSSGGSFNMGTAKENSTQLGKIYKDRLQFKKTRIYAFSAGWWSAEEVWPCKIPKSVLDQESCMENS